MTKELIEQARKWPREDHGEGYYFNAMADEIERLQQYEKMYHDAVAEYRQRGAAHEPAVDWDAALKEFTAYFVRNYPGQNTIISDPTWHAPKIFRAAKHAIKSASKSPQGECPTGDYEQAGVVAPKGNASESPASSQPPGADAELARRLRHIANVAYCYKLQPKEREDILRAADLAVIEVAALRRCLQFYADGVHFMLSAPEEWDTVTGEPQNFWCDAAGTATVEDGSLAKMALEGKPIAWDKDEQQELPLSSPPTKEV